MATRIQTMKVADLKPAPYNPRRIDPAAMQGLTKSIERFGVVETLVWNERTNHLVGGHQRLKVMRAQKITETPVTVVDLDEIDEKALNVALNSQHIAGDFTDALQGILAEIAASSEQLYADLRFDELIAEIVRPALHGDPDDVPDIPAIAITQPGDVWTLGRHRLICGDSADPAVLSKLLGEERVDCLLTDPPYGVDYGAKNEFMNDYIGKMTGKRGGSIEKRIEKRIENDLSTPNGYRVWFASWMALIPWSDYATYFVFMSDREMHNVRNAIDDLDWKFGALLAWVKNSQVFGRTDYAFQHELVCYGWPVRHRFYGATNATTVLNFDRPMKSDLHPTMKPVALLEQLLSDGSADGAIILDSFGGSGSTLIACEASKRHARLCEIDDLYCDVIAQRYCNATGKPALLNGEPQDAITPQG